MGLLEAGGRDVTCYTVEVRQLEFAAGARVIASIVCQLNTRGPPALTVQALGPDLSICNTAVCSLKKARALP